MKIKKKTITMIWLAICLFIYIFDPPIIKGISFLQIGIFISFAYVCFRHQEVVKLIANRFTRKFWSKIGIYIVYCFILNIILFVFKQSDTLIAEKNLSEAVSVLTTYSMLLLPVVAILVFAKRHKLDTVDIINTLIITYMMQFVLVVLAFLFPGIKNTFVTLIFNNSNNEYIQKIVYGSATRRVYGFASNLWDVFGASCSIMTTVAYNFFLYKDKKYIVPTLAILFMIALNSRAGLLIVLVALLVSTFIYLSHKLSFKKLIRVMSIPVIAILGFTSFVQIVDKTSLDWISSAFSEVGELLVNKESSGTLNYFTSSFLIFPETIFQVVFGQGLRPRDLIGINTDIGYIEMIWKYGVFGSLMVYSAYFGLIKQVRKHNDEYLRYGIIAIFVVISIFQIKTNLIGVNAVTILLTIILLKYVTDFSYKKEGLSREGI